MRNSDKEDYFNSSSGAPVTNDTSSVTVGERGPVLLQDLHLIDKLSHFDRERIPERVVHASIIKLLPPRRSFIS